MNFPGKHIDLNSYNVKFLAQSLGVSRQTLYNVWNGKNRPSVDLAIKIYRLLNAMPGDSFDFFKLWD